MEKENWKLCLNGAAICTLDSLRENWEDEKIYESYASGALLAWLEYFFYEEEAEQLRQIGQGGDVLESLRAILLKECTSKEDPARCQEFSDEQKKSSADDEEEFSRGKTEASKRNYEAASEIFTRLYKRGHINAMAYLGVFYLDGRGVEKDTHRGVSLLLSASRLGLKEAMNELADVFSDSWTKGEPRCTADAIRALEWHRKAADRGSKDSRMKLHM